MKRIFLLFIYIIVHSILFAQIKTFSIQDIRQKYFIISKLPDPIIKAPQGSTFILYKGYSPIGKFRIMIPSANYSICELVEGSFKHLDSDCYFKFDIPIKIDQPTQTETNTTVPTTPLQTEIKPQENLPFSIMNIQFLRNKDIITSKAFPFSRFGTVEELNGFIDQLNLKSHNKYNFTIPSDLMINQNSSWFESLISGKLGFCLYNGRIGYFRFSDKKPVFKNIQLETLSQFANEILVIIVSSEVENEK